MFDAHKAYLIAHDPDTKEEAVLYLSRALFRAGCYIEPHQLLLNKANPGLQDPNTEPGNHIITPFNVSQVVWNAVTTPYETTELLEHDLHMAILTPALQDGSVRVVQYRRVVQ